MIHLSIDLGQIIISVLLAVVGFFVKYELKNLTGRLDNHETRIINLIGDVSSILGYCRARNCSLFTDKE